MTEPIIVTTTDLRASLAKHLQAASGGRVIYVMSHGYRVAAIVPVAVAEEIVNASKGRGE